MPGLGALPVPRRAGELPDRLRRVLHGHGASPARPVPQLGSSAVALPPPLWKGWPSWIGFYQQRRVKVEMTNEPVALPQPLVPVPSALTWAHLEMRPPLGVWRGGKFSRVLLEVTKGDEHGGI